MQLPFLASIAVVSTSRVIVKMGDIKRLSTKSGPVQLRFMEKEDLLTLIVFNDLVLITKKKR